MKIYRSSIYSGKETPVEEVVGEFPKECFERSYPLMGIKDARLLGVVQKFDDIVVFEGTIEGTLLLSDARTNEVFEQRIEKEETVNLLDDDPDGEAEGYLFPGNGIELSEVLYSLLRSETPIKPLKEDSSFSRQGEGWSVYLEGEEPKLEEGSPFDVLKDYDYDE